MKMKSKTILTWLLGATFAVSTALLGAQLFTQKGDVFTSGAYGDAFTAYAETTAEEIGAMKGMQSIDGNYLLLATALKIDDYGAYTAVGYEITENGNPLVADGLETSGYYTSITVKTEGDPVTYTMEDIFAGEQGVTGMIVAEVPYNAYKDYSIKAYVVKNEDKIYNGGNEMVGKVNVAKTLQLEAAEATMSGSATVITGSKGQKSSYLDFVDFPDGEEGTATFSVVAKQAGRAVLSICSGHREEYALNSVYTIKVNGVDIAISDRLVSGSGWFNWIIEEYATINLKEGVNDIAITCGENYHTLDYITLGIPEGQSLAPVISKLEAKDAVVDGVATIVTDTGKKWSSNLDYVDFHGDNGTSTVTFTYDAVFAGQLKFVICLGSRDGGSLSDFVTVEFNGEELDLSGITVVDGPQTGGNAWQDWTEVEVGTFDVVAGTNTIVFTVGNCLLDYVSLQLVTE